jgi:hypothetical protein
MALDLTGAEKLVFMAELKRAISEALSPRIRMLHAVLDILEPPGAAPTGVKSTPGPPARPMGLLTFRQPFRRRQ